VKRGDGGVFVDQCAVECRGLFAWSKGVVMRDLGSNMIHRAQTATIYFGVYKGIKPKQYANCIRNLACRNTFISFPTSSR
jgi:hypothetical protein